MLIQSRVVADVMIGRDSGWNAQNRDDQAMPFKACARVQAAHVVAGVGFGWLRVKSGSLLAPVLAHIATNSLTFAIAWAYWH